ncbi:hypothetical protein SAMN05444365_10227 [Micromonospora pattaloongensis]|uniref:MYXO-CTERM domain-containing protein n=1 Tax=Micromonospora pattaloongensis TaxID=405436 RepID=A0A1H3JCQ5_9ACTN|nr:hypothetical protein [Micromonospora pattaloongensis]SDY36984.1 hypothetical protein SAMN05444365_10227 [Micromonospora pattaloongensis]
MRGIRRTSLLLTVAAVPVAALWGPAPARAADVFVEVNPSTVEAGYLVGIRASCPTNTEPATVESDAFGSVTVRPQYDLLTAAATVPQDRRARSYRVRLACPGGRAATTTLRVVSGIRPSRGPATGFGGAAGGDGDRLLVGGGLAAIAVGLALGLRARARRT